MAATKAELLKMEERRIGDARCRAAAKKPTKVVDGGKKKEGHREVPRVVAAAGGEITRSAPS